jgi:hypothetical protein
MSCGLPLRSMNQFEEPHLLRWERHSRLPHERLGAIQHQGFLRVQGEQGALARRKARGVEDPSVDIFDF